VKLRVSDLWRWDGTIDRGPYAVLGVALMLVKYGVDRWLTWGFTGLRLDPWIYWIRTGSVADRLSGPRHASYAYVLLAAALPFVWSGVVLTLRRLRSAALPKMLVLLFFVPFVNALFFVMLCALRGRPHDGSARDTGGRSRFLDRLMPETQIGSALMSVALVVPVTAALAYLSAQYLGKYGWGLFVGLPFFVGLASVLLYGYREPRSFGACVTVAVAAVGILGVGLFLFAIEGAICILMAAPIGAVLAFVGASIGWAIQMQTRASDTSATYLALSLAMPLLLLADASQPEQPPEYRVETSIDIDAPRERVWNEVVAFSELPPPTEIVFRAGIAYPMRAEIDGRGVGAIRRCVFSTGAFVEPIEVWDEPRRLEFSVASEPRAMTELMPWPGADPPHVSDYFVSRRGRFDLVALEGDRTRLVGTTWYTHKIWPSAYWRVYSDRLLHKIHRRVLDHIRAQAESAERSARAR
jgi:hypothetical protein